MCFSSKPKTPKTDPESLKAPEPVLLDEPKGVDLGASEDDQGTETGVDGLTVKKDSTTKTVTGDGSTTATATDTGMVKKSSAPIKRALKKATQ